MDVLEGAEFRVRARAEVAEMNLRDFVEKTPDVDLLREMIGFEHLMELGLGVATGAALRCENPMRRAGGTAAATGRRICRRATRAGTVHLRLPKFLVHPCDICQDTSLAMDRTVLKLGLEEPLR